MNNFSESSRSTQNKRLWQNFIFFLHFRDHSQVSDSSSGGPSAPAPILATLAAQHGARRSERAATLESSQLLSSKSSLLFLHLTRMSFYNVTLREIEAQWLFCEESLMYTRFFAQNTHTLTHTCMRFEQDVCMYRASVKVACSADFTVVSKRACITPKQKREHPSKRNMKLDIFWRIATVLSYRVVISIKYF